MGWGGGKSHNEILSYALIPFQTTHFPLNQESEERMTTKDKGVF